MKNNFPSKRQLEIYDYIVEYMLKYQYSPSVRDISKGVGLKSTSGAYAHLDALKYWGLIDFQPAQPRTIQLKGYKLVRE